MATKKYKAIFLPKKLHYDIKFRAIKRKMTMIQYVYELLRIEKQSGNGGG